MSTEQQLREILEHAKALRDSMQFIYQSDEGNIWRYGSFSTYMRKYNEIVARANKVVNLEGLVDYYKLDKIPSVYDTIAIQQKAYFDAAHANLSLLISFLNNKLNIRNDQIQDLRNFFQCSLRKATLKEPNQESDVQDTIEQLLIGKGLVRGLDYDRETGRVKVSIKEVIPDFIFPKLDLALEVKFTNSSTKAKAIVDQINADIQAYGKAYSNIMFIIYDLGTIRDEDEFKNDIDNKLNTSVVIVKH
jgi:hypothetical protein